MKKKLTILLVIATCICMALALAACDGLFGGSNVDGNENGNEISSGNDESSSGNNSSSGGSSSGGNDSSNSSSSGSQAVPLPTSAEIVEARNNSASQSVQEYDFNLTFSGNFDLSGLNIGSTLQGVYDGKYRYNADSDELKFKRTTSGALLADSTCYMFTAGNNSRIKATMDKTAVKKVSVETTEDQDITMVNLPVVKIVDSAGVSNISNIAKSNVIGYSYSCKLSAGNSNLAYTALSKVFEKLGTGVSFKGITFSENTSTLDFNLKDGKLDDFRLAFKLQIGVNDKGITINVVYAQKANSASFSTPSLAGFVYDTAGIQTQVNAINAAIEDLKDDPVYSLDLVAANEFDPGWNKLAIVDKYTARMYKTTIDGAVWFNHSYVYKSHSETDGSENYKYTLGNVNGSNADNQGTWLITRKGSNTQTQEPSVTADTQFNFLTAIAKLQASEIDCIQKLTSGNSTTYTFYLGKSATQSVQQKIVDMINTNDYGDVIEVNNYFNAEENVINEASIQVVVTSGKISSIVCNTEINYTPTGGEYTEYNVTLNNTIELQVNANYDSALAYVPPTRVKAVAMGIGKNLNDAEYYIL